HRERRAVQRYIGSSIDGKSGGIAARNIADLEVHRIEIRFQRSDGVLRQESRFRLAEVERVFAVEFAGLDRVVKFLQGSQKLDGNKSRSGHAHLHLKNSPRRFVTHGFEWSADGASGVGKILLKAGAQLNDGHANVAEFHDVKAVEAIANVFAAQAENGLARLHQLREVGLQTGKVGTRLDRFRNGITRSFDLREGIVAVKIENVRRSADGLKGNPVNGHRRIAVNVGDFRFNGDIVRHLAGRQIYAMEKKDLGSFSKLGRCGDRGRQKDQNGAGKHKKASWKLKHRKFLTKIGRIRL